MEEELDTCAESAGCSAMGTGEGWDCSLLADMYPSGMETSYIPRLCISPTHTAAWS
jgi:hypothetical protein